jgi:AcrR family transcriptional regulator
MRGASDGPARKADPLAGKSAPEGTDPAGAGRAGAGRAGAGRAGAGRAAHRGNRHQRSEEARQAVLEAADDLLVERGFAGLTIEGIAARAGVAKQTIYRWWPSKAEVLMDAFVDDAAEYLSPPDTGDLGRDLRLHLSKLADFLTQTDAGAVFAPWPGRRSTMAT